jgi:hypothetical protein
VAMRLPSLPLETGLISRFYRLVLVRPSRPEI